MGKLNRLTALKVERIAGPGMYADGGGLYLQVTARAAGRINKSWLYRYEAHGRERQMGLGPIAAVSLGEARRLAADARRLREQDIDPIDHRNASRATAAAVAAKTITFDECAASYIAAHEAAWTNARHGRDWRVTLKRYASPTLGKLAVADIDRSLVLGALQPIWHRIPVTAGRLRGRIELILDHAEARGYRPEGSNPARLAPIRAALGRRPKRTEHFAALPFAELPAFMVALRERQGVSFRALEFAVLCAARTGEVRGARWDEVDLTVRTWTVPPKRMKAGKEHRVPLSDAAVKLLRALPRELGNDFVFAGSRGKGLGERALFKALRLIHPTATAHGMRSAFKDWASERTDFPTEAVELALAHTVGSKVEQAYRRGDLLERRRLLMVEWAAHCARAPADSEVVPLRSKVARAAAKS
jgi:integrase